MISHGIPSSGNCNKHLSDMVMSKYILLLAFNQISASYSKRHQTQNVDFNHFFGSFFVPTKMIAKIDAIVVQATGIS